MFAGFLLTSAVGLLALDPLPPGVVVRYGTDRFCAPGATGLAFSADGRRVVAFGGPDSTPVFDVGSGRRVATLLSCQNAQLTPDGRTALLERKSQIGGTIGTISLVDVATGAERLIANQSHRAAVSADGRLVCHDSRSGLRVVRAADGMPVLDERIVEDARSFAFTPAGRLAVVVEQPGRELRLYDPRSGALLRWQPLPETDDCDPAESDTPPRFLWANGGRHLVVHEYRHNHQADRHRGHDEDFVRVFDAETGTLVADLVPQRAGVPKVPEWHASAAHFDAVLEFEPSRREAFRSVTVSPDGQWLAWTGREWGTGLRHVPSGREFGLPGLPESVTFMPDSRSLAYFDRETITFLDVGTRAVRRPRGAAGFAETAAASPDGKWVAVSGSDHTVELRDAVTGRVVHSLVGNYGQSRRLVFSRDGRRLLACNNFRAVRVWDVATGEALASLTIPIHASLDNIAFTPDGRGVVTDGQAARTDPPGVRVWDAVTGVAALPTPLPQELESFASTSSDGLAAGSVNERQACTFDIATGRRVATLNWPEAAGRLYRLDAGGRIATVVVPVGGEDRQAVRVFDARTGRPRPTIRPGGNLFGVTVSPDARLMAFGTAKAGDPPREHTAVYELASGVRLAECPSHPLAFSADGRLVLVRGGATWVDGYEAEPACTDGPLAASDRAEMWDRLATPTLAGRAAMHRLAADPGVVPFLRTQIAGRPRIADAEVARWVADLDSPAFAVREAATAKLVAAGPRGETAVRSAVASESAEVRTRAAAVLDRVAGQVHPEEMRLVRAVEALERCGTADAKKLLAELAKDADPRLADEAAAALARLKQAPLTALPAPPAPAAAP